ncbi:MAG TPA: hypothetical protein VI542_03070 [Candidatus Tectomicrobia bacterium]
MSLRKKDLGSELSQPRSTDFRLDALTLEEQEMVVGGQYPVTISSMMNPATRKLAVLRGSLGPEGQVMVVVDGIIMNKDELGLI